MDPLNLNIDIQNHDASRPVLPAGTYQGQIAGAEVVESKNAAGNYNLMVTVKTIEPYESTKGTPINAGYSLKRWFPLQASEKQIEMGMGESFKDQLAIMVDNLFGTTAEDRPALNQDVITQMIGKAITFTTTVRSDDQYGDGNDLGRMLAA